jgi:hypothetical protein
LINAFYSSLLTGEISANLQYDGLEKEVEDLIDNYSQSIRLAKEVSEMGEFMNSFSCDFFQQANRVYFVNRMRRLDGQEYYFLSAPDTNIRLAHMFVNRLRDLRKAGEGNIQLNKPLKDELESLKKDIDALLET